MLQWFRIFSGKSISKKKKKKISPGNNSTFMMIYKYLYILRNCRIVILLYNLNDLTMKINN